MFQTTNQLINPRCFHEFCSEILLEILLTAAGWASLSHGWKPWTIEIIETGDVTTKKPLFTLDFPAGHV